MATCAPPVQYIDFLLLGKTGMGKSTTADRLLTAGYAADHQLVDYRDVEIETGTKVSDIIIWRLGNRDMEAVKSRVINFLVDCSGQEASLTHDPESTTKYCALLSNEHTRVRVLDVPGFHATYTPPNLQDRSDDVAHRANLAIMRQILRIQAEKKLHFRRILYFLPSRGPMEKADANFQGELKIMHHYFGRMIFESMVVVATVPRRRSKVGYFSGEDFKETQSALRKALELILPPNNGEPVLSVPPVFYISLEENSSEMFGRLQLTVVNYPDGLELRLVDGTCANCGLKFAVYGGERRGKRVVSLTATNEWVAYDESRCHPLIKPKFSKLQKFLGGIAHIVLFGLPTLSGQIPWFSNDQEECAVCKAAPGPLGCQLVGQVCKVKTEEGDALITVDHTSKLDQIAVVVD